MQFHKKKRWPILFKMINATIVFEEPIIFSLQSVIWLLLSPWWCTQQINHIAKIKKKILNCSAQAGVQAARSLKYFELRAVFGSTIKRQSIDFIFCSVGLVSTQVDQILHSSILHLTPLCFCNIIFHVAKCLSVANIVRQFGKIVLQYPHIKTILPATYRMSWNTRIRRSKAIIWSCCLPASSRQQLSSIYFHFGVYVCGISIKLTQRFGIYGQSNALWAESTWVQLWWRNFPDDICF